MKNQFVCPICHGTVMPLPYSREPLAPVIQRHMQQVHEPPRARKYSDVRLADVTDT